MMQKLVSIQLVFSVFLSSIGFRVMHHHCIWCGGDRIEMIAAGMVGHVSPTCCESKETCCNHEGSQHPECCREELVKINEALASGDNVQVQKPAVLDLDKVMAVPELVAAGGQIRENQVYGLTCLDPPPPTDDLLIRLLSIHC